MARTVVLDELFVTLRTPADLSEVGAAAARRTLGGDDLLARLRRAVRAVIRSYPELACLLVTVSR